MYAQVASKLVVTSTSPEASQAVSMAGANSVEVDITVFAVSGGTLTVKVQESNDLQNWSDVGSATVTATAASYKTITTSNVIASAYVRIHYSITATNTAVLAAGINTASL